MMRGPVFGIEILGFRQQVRVQGVAMRFFEKRFDSAATAIRGFP
jgi:hypothetical protein